MANTYQNKSTLIMAEKPEQEKQFSVVVRVEKESGKTIKKVYLVKPKAKIVSRESSETMTSVSGVVSVAVSYETDGGEFIVTKGEASFAEEILTAGVNSTLFQANVMKFDTISVDENAVVLSVTIQLEASSIVSEEVAKTFDEVVGLVEDKCMHEVSKVLGASTANFSLSAEVSGNFSENARVCMRDAEAVILSAVSSLDVVILEGEIFYTAWISDDGKIQEVKAKESFRQEVDCFDANPGSITRATIVVSDVMAGVSHSDAGSTVSFSADLMSNQLSFATEVIECVQDAFSVLEKASLSVEYVNVTKVENVQYLRSDLEVEIDTEGRIGVDEILGVVCDNVEIQGTRFDGTHCEISGMMDFCVCYKNNVDESIQSFDCNVPFDAKFVGDTAFCDISCVKFVPTAIKLKAGSGVDVQGEIFARGDQTKTEEIMYVSDITSSPVEEESKYAIKVYTVMEDDRLFDVAKQLGVTPETLLAQNPELENGLVPNEKVYVYIPLVASF